ncbi:uncharacterized protein ACA1_143440 [Acanthamoeba castellanii str. Neff]|uniref:Uncharacterized protein n=1 Tax=Acanthamoeba castellanii (strain ATCC 30010 / Neff) TaxID=1257118 RepID=L8HEL9_ACACF|nr:uncharacterized protein ACA1_143440 [Acanthamoeba castellanii str. Neff]ELR23974.1 hypothetical protein ACA1_143440 [Acanthamoeba castellanii str. Neff]
MAAAGKATVEYEVNLRVKKQVEGPFLEWLRAHMRDMVETTRCFVSARLYSQEASRGTTRPPAMTRLTTCATWRSTGALTVPPSSTTSTTTPRPCVPTASSASPTNSQPRAASSISSRASNKEEHTAWLSHQPQDTASGISPARVAQWKGVRLLSGRLWVRSPP